MVLSEWLLVVITIAICAMVGIGAWLASRLAPALESLRTAADRLGRLATPAEGVLHEAQRELQELRTLTQRANAVVEDIESVAHSSRRVASEAVDVVNMVGVTRRARAAAAGARAGLMLLKHAVTRR
jgi:uncharacterized protein YoxC